MKKTIIILIAALAFGITAAAQDFTLIAESDGMRFYVDAGSAQRDATSVVFIGRVERDKDNFTDTLFSAECASRAFVILAYKGRAEGKPTEYVAKTPPVRVAPPGSAIGKALERVCALPKSAG